MKRKVCALCWTALNSDAESLTVFSCTIGETKGDPWLKRELVAQDKT